ncbi:probable disease resistance protein At4g33300 [Cryptomeria japonica]|uniref:probable disease resistance protein At4g33300 n=1 Tax=Cryptomeria japonica TaxID=3369 RepID=UPI0027DA4C0C|nr:probable disease resistance protein At4g33300 [Cryptomeria japonica]XP_057865161.2 probable disease resistance protein At4g33300 [Cryptomeria japonica]
MLSCIMGLAWFAEGFLKSCGGEIASLFSPWIRQLWHLVFPSSSTESSRLPDLPEKIVGLDVRLEELKTRLFAENVKKLGVTAMGGGGKTTLAAALCRDPDVKERFGDKIIYRKVSDFSERKDILESIWVGITNSRSTPNFQSIQVARKRVEEWLSSRPTQNILVVLDDVWLDDSHLKDLIFEADGYKTIVMSRHIVEWLDDIYELPLLEESDALALFCYYAFEQTSIPERGYDKILVQQVAEQCQQLPLALEVIGSSLYEKKNRDEWIYYQKKLSEGGRINSNHEENLLKILALSIDRLHTIDNNNIIKECFLDLILFPGVKEIHVDTLFDIWIYAHNLTLYEARRTLNVLERRRLLRLVNHDIGGHRGISHGIACELYIVQHDMLRKLAIYLVENNQSEDICKRLI